MQWLWGTISILMGILSVLSCWNVALRLYRAWWFPLIADNGTWVKFGASIMFCRLISGFFAVSEKNLPAVTQRSVMSGMLYLCVCILSVLVPFPKGGFTPRVLSQ